MIVVALSSTKGVGPVVIGVVIGALVAMIGQAVTHHYTLRRERRAEIVAAVESLVTALVAMDRRIHRLITLVGPNMIRSDVQEAADAVSDAEERSRVALFLLRIRVDANTDMLDAFEGTMQRYTSSYIALEPMLTGRDTRAIKTAHELFDQARESREEAMRVAGSYLRRAR